MKSMDVNCDPCGIHDLWRSVSGHGLVERFQAWLGLQCDRQPPGQNFAGEPVDDGSQIDKTTGHALPGRRLRGNLPRGGIYVISIAQT